MKCGWTMLAAAGLASISTGAAAADNIACMDAPFSAEDQATFDQYNKSFNLETFDSKGPPPETLTILSARAGECAETHDWAPEAIEHALVYKLGGVLEDALAASSTLSAAQWKRLETAYATADKAILARLFNPMVEAEMTGQKAAEPSRADQLYLGRLMLRTGIPATEANSKFVGAWMAARAMQSMYSDRFTKS